MNQAEKSKRSREQIILAAAEEFGANPFENASLNKICQQNKISKGKIYHHFKSKEELFLSCLEYAVNKMIEYSIIDFDSDMKLEDKYRTIFIKRQEFVLTYPHLAIFIYRALKSSPKYLQKEIGEHFTRYRASISQTLYNVFKPYPWFKIEQLPIFAEIFILASNRVHEIGMRNWDPYDPPEKQKDTIDKNFIIFDDLIHIFLYGIIPLDYREE